MYIARILYPIQVLGPGKRIGIWFDGCPHHCAHCSNPELWEFQERYKTTLQTVMQLIDRIASAYPVDGITITGGDPFYQYEELRALLDYLQTITADILVYTGFNYSDVKSKDLRGISVLIDGKYVDELNTGLPLRGSENQNMIILDKQLEPMYRNYLDHIAPNAIQNFDTQDGIVSVGIHKKGFSF